MLGAGYSHPHLQPPLFESCGVPSIQHPGPLLCQFPKCSAHTRKRRGCFQYEDLVLVRVALVASGHTNAPPVAPLHQPRPRGYTALSVEAGHWASGHL